MKTDDMTIWYKDYLVGTLQNCFLSDGVWYGVFEPPVTAADSQLAKQIGRYVSFCVAWNEKIRQGDSDTDSSQFAVFDDIVCDGCWKAITSDGHSIDIEDAPVFFAGGEVSFRKKLRQ